ncbi:EamA family transporter [Nakamurella deserti]|uniref:EamA family transporter n=1 Tax=Nakamurella deserti TaxID=2164074 RepID=UPI001F0C4BF3|nr:EamA family transporter [Nakamurella deserti]
MPSPRNLIAVTPAPALFLVSGFTQYYGAALAVGLFVLAPSAVVGWLRIVVSAIILLAWRRPWKQGWSRRELLASAGFGVVLAAMNLCFYVAIEHLPLGTAVAIEFLGPVAVAAITGTGWRDRLGIALALAGVVLLAGVSLEGGWTTSVVIGLVAIFGSGLFWAFYIILGRRIASTRDGITSLSVGMTAGALVFAPFCVWQVGGIVSHGPALLALVGIAVLSSVIPYAIEQVVLRKVTAARFAILLALLPVTAAVTGAVFLAQIPHAAEITGMALVCAAIVLSARKSGGELATG